LDLRFRDSKITLNSANSGAEPPHVLPLRYGAFGERFEHELMIDSLGSI